MCIKHAARSRDFVSGSCYNRERLQNFPASDRPPSSGSHMYLSSEPSLRWSSMVRALADLVTTPFSASLTVPPARGGGKVNCCRLIDLNLLNLCQASVHKLFFSVLCVSYVL